LPHSGFLICGLDEAGRGPLAGPVCAAAVILSEEESERDFPISILCDSKRMSPAARESAKNVICREATAWGIGWATVAEIDEINIHKASLLAMKRAFCHMLDVSNKPGNKPLDIGNIYAIADGLFVPDIPAACRPMVKADNAICEVMAASILAKTARDRLMEYYGIFYPQYGYETHKGYPTKAHREAVKCYGPSPIQRLSFRIS
jgi:ribonuclease HII